MSENFDSVVNQGQFHAKVKPSNPLETRGHHEGVQASPADRIPTFNAETLPPGSAPAESTYQPNPNPENMGGMYQKASTTLTGADSSDVHTGYGHPGQGMTSTELRHDGQQGGKKQAVGNLGRGSNAVSDGPNAVNPHDPAFADQRALDKDVPTGRYMRQ